MFSQGGGIFRVGRVKIKAVEGADEQVNGLGAGQEAGFIGELMVYEVYCMEEGSRWRLKKSGAVSRSTWDIPMKK
jgi:hypothetical protein